MRSLAALLKKDRGDCPILSRYKNRELQRDERIDLKGKGWTYLLIGERMNVSTYRGKDERIDLKGKGWTYLLIGERMNVSTYRGKDERIDL